MEKDLDYYVSNLVESRHDDVCDDHPSNFLQSTLYPDKPNPINTNPQKINVDFQTRTSTNTYSLWACLAGIVDQIHLIGTPTMKKNNVQFLTQTLKDYLSDKTIHSFLTGRRVYPIMELLDKPRIEFEKKHQNAIGYFISFLINKSIYVLENEYKWSRDCEDSNMRLIKNNDGYWFVEKSTTF